jgi:hypothetical protein
VRALPHYHVPRDVGGSAVAAAVCVGGGFDTHRILYINTSADLCLLFPPLFPCVQTAAAAVAAEAATAAAEAGAAAGAAAGATAGAAAGAAVDAAGATEAVEAVGA